MAVSLPSHDLHNHTVHCGHADADATVANLVSRARDLQIDVLGISEHVMRVSDLAAIDTIRNELRAISTGDTEVLLAAEMDLDTQYADGRWVTPAAGCDYIILSAHGFPQFDLDIPASDQRLETHLQRRHLAQRWLDWYRHGIERGGFHLLGHPLREPLVMNIVDLTDDELMEDVIASFVPAIEQGIAFELNEAFLNALMISPQYEPYLSMSIRLRKRGMRFARGSDSHGMIKVGACRAIESFARDAQLQPGDWLDATQFRPGWR